MSDIVKLNEATHSVEGGFIVGQPFSSATPQSRLKTIEGTKLVSGIADFPSERFLDGPWHEDSSGPNSTV